MNKIFLSKKPIASYQIAVPEPQYDITIMSNVDFDMNEYRLSTFHNFIIYIFFF